MYSNSKNNLKKITSVTARAAGEGRLGHREVWGGTGDRPELGVAPIEAKAERAGDGGHQHVDGAEASTEDADRSEVGIEDAGCKASGGDT
jgi:hypothetical protein